VEGQLEGANRGMNVRLRIDDATGRVVEKGMGRDRRLVCWTLGGEDPAIGVRMLVPAAGPATQAAGGTNMTFSVSSPAMSGFISPGN
jgi:hypothetical protein